MPRLRSFIAILTIALSFALSVSTARAVLIHDAEPARPGRTFETPFRSADSVQAGDATAIHLLSNPHRDEGQQLVSSDPCANETGWLPQERDGVLFCGTLADFYAPKIIPYPDAQTAEFAGGSGLALLLFGIAALGLAARRPVWISRLMR